MASLAQPFVAFSSGKLNQLAGRIEDCLGRLTPEQVWLRRGENQNAAGNLVLHLCGNVRQWIISAVGGAPDIRDRDSEFAARDGLAPAELTDLLRRTVHEACEVIDRLTPQRLGATIRPQKFELTVLEAIYHVIEHFAMHTGQIMFITKMFLDSDLGYYGHLSQGGPEREKIP